MRNRYVVTPTSRCHVAGARTREEAIAHAEGFHRAELDTCLSAVVDIRQGRTPPMDIDEATLRWLAEESLMSLIHIGLGRVEVVNADA